MLVDLPPNMDNGSRNYSVNCRSADSGWQIHSIRTSIAIIGITMNLYVHTTEDEKHKEIEKNAAAIKVV